MWCQLQTLILSVDLKWGLSFSKPHHFIRGIYCEDPINAALCLADYLYAIVQQMLWIRLQGKHCTKLCKPNDVNINYYKHKYESSSVLRFWAIILCLIFSDFRKFLIKRWSKMWFLTALPNQWQNGTLFLRVIRIKNRFCCISWRRAAKRLPHSKSVLMFWFSEYWHIWIWEI